MFVTVKTTYDATLKININTVRYIMIYDFRVIFRYSEVPDDYLEIKFDECKNFEELKAQLLEL